MVDARGGLFGRHRGGGVPGVRYEARHDPRAGHSGDNLLGGLRMTPDLGHQAHRNLGAGQVARPGLPAIPAAVDGALGGAHEEHLRVGRGDLDGGDHGSIQKGEPGYQFPP